MTYAAWLRLSGSSAKSASTFARGEVNGKWVQVEVVDRVVGLFDDVHDEANEEHNKDRA